MSVSFVARQAGISPSQLFAWKRRMLACWKVFSPSMSWLG
ncbi:MAG: transposase [Beijerinckiaceae bacterium]|nr:transposase [Beijerinckiaceae bacterium]